MNWIMLGSGIGVRFESSYLRWIYWKSGIQTQEGLLTWGPGTNGIVPWSEDGPRHMHRPDTEIVSELLDSDITAKIIEEVRCRQQSTRSRQRAHFGRVIDT